MASTSRASIRPASLATGHRSNSQSVYNKRTACRAGTITRSHVLRMSAPYNEQAVKRSARVIKGGKCRQAEWPYPNVY